MTTANSNTVVELDLIVTAEMPTPSGYLFRAEGAGYPRRLLDLVRPGGEKLLSPCLAYAVHHPRAGTILIDTGMHPDAQTNLRGDFGLAMSVLFRGLRPARSPFDEQLRTLGIEPESITRAIMTHLHVDHTSGMRLLPNAAFTCSREEWAAASGSMSATKGYVGHHLPPADRMQLLDYEIDGKPHGPFGATIDLFDDGSVRLISTPGHTSGHQSVLLRLKGPRQVLVVGDAAYTLRSFREGILPMLTVDDEASLRAMGEIKAFAEADPQAIVVPTHDPTAWHELRQVTTSAERAVAGL